MRADSTTSYEPAFHRRIITLSACLGAAVGLVVAGWLLTRQKPTNRNMEMAEKSRPYTPFIAKVNQPLPPYQLADLSNQEIPADKLRHGRVLLVYLTTSCEPCIREAEIISRLQHVPADLHIYGVYIERPAQVESFIKEFDLKFPMLIDVDARLAKSLDIHYFPSKYFIEDGVITEIWRGTTDDEAKLQQRINIK